MKKAGGKRKEERGKDILKTFSLLPFLFPLNRGVW
jgi:hypothetical protein